MRVLILAFAIIFASPTRADQCDASAGSIAAEVGGSVRTRIGPSIKLRHPATENFSISCDGPKIWRVSTSKDGPGPMSPMAHLLAQTSALALGTTEATAAAVMLKCIRSAAGAAGTIASATGHGLLVECYMLRDFVTIDIQRASR